MALGIIGAGKWGEALFKAFLTKDSNVIITSRTERKIQNFVSLNEVLKRDYLVIAVASQSLKQFLKNIDLSGKKVLVASKGIDKDNFKFINELYEEYLPKENIAYIGGPSFAKEVKEYKPTALVLASYNLSLAKEFSAFFPEFIKTYIDNDVMGVEIAGAYKNVIAISAGICEGLGLGKNAAAALISRGLVEMQRFGLAYGAKEDTFTGLGGAGDLFLTASSNMSRNFRVGLGIAKGKSQEDILKELGEVAEGIGTTYALHEISQDKDLYLPIAKEVYNMLEGKNRIESLRDLLSN